MAKEGFITKNVTKRTSVCWMAGAGVFLLLFLSGCSAFYPRRGHYQNSSVMDFLYPNTQQQAVEVGTPYLRLPLRVGLAFTPGIKYRSNGITEDKRIELLTRLGSHFDELPFVESIEIIPSGYLRPEGSFENLDAVRRMFAVDVIALVSYDQTRFSGDSFLSVAYWTIVGAYLVPGEKNSTHTMLDAVIYDIPSRKLLFRAPGTSQIKSRSTPVGADERLRSDAVRGFDAASEDLVVHLGEQLEVFKKRVREKPKEFQVVHREGYKGSGSTGGLFLLLILLFGINFLKRIS